MTNNAGTQDGYPTGIYKGEQGTHTLPDTETSPPWEAYISGTEG